MSGDTAITLAGNLVHDPELRYTPAGQPVARFRVASTPRYLDKTTNEWKDGESLFCWFSAITTGTPSGVQFRPNSPIAPDTEEAAGGKIA